MEDGCMAAGQAHGRAESLAVSVFDSGCEVRSKAVELRKDDGSRRPIETQAGRELACGDAPQERVREGGVEAW